jgi:archaeal type IV pilus assembly protein PilA
MNVFGKKERGWRKARKRGVSPIIATILLVAITVVLAAVLYVLISGLTSGGASSVPIGTTFAYGTPTQSANTNCGSGTIAAGSCYAVGIQSAGSSATTANIHFGVLKSGTGVAFGTVQLLSASGTVLATYTGGTTNSWAAASGSTLPISFSSTQTLLVTSTVTSGSSATSIEGDSLEAIGVGSISGSVSVVLP